MATLVKTTLDGRKLEVVGLAICLDGKLGRPISSR